MEPEASLPSFQARLTQALSDHHLEVLGSFEPTAQDVLPGRIKSVLLIGLSEPGFWGHFKAQPEWRDGAADPMDRWSRRVLEDIASKVNGMALFPFGGPPYHPFFSWALRTGQIWSSPVQLLVHAKQGLMVSFRGALALEQVCHHGASVKPCESCPQPCLTACPARALTEGNYDVPACHRFLDTPAGEDCLSSGCLVRRACPVSQAYARLPEQSAYHMSRFHRAE